jgi:hypothetical protein
MHVSSDPVDLGLRFHQKTRGSSLKFAWSHVALPDTAAR